MQRVLLLLFLIFQSTISSLQFWLTRDAVSNSAELILEEDGRVELVVNSDLNPIGVFSILKYITQLPVGLYNDAEKTHKASTISITLLFVTLSQLVFLFSYFRSASVSVGLVVYVFCLIHHVSVLIEKPDKHTNSVGTNYTMGTSKKRKVYYFFTQWFHSLSWVSQWVNMVMVLLFSILSSESLFVELGGFVISGRFEV